MAVMRRVTHSIVSHHLPLLGAVSSLKVLRFDGAIGAV